jgi:chromosomal replication initiator protein
MQLYEEYWEQVLAMLELKLSDITFNTWIKSLVPAGMTDTTFILKTETPVVKDMIEHKYIGDIVDAITFINGQNPLEVKVMLANDSLEEALKPTPKVEPKRSTVTTGTITRMENGLMPAYTFDNFIVGNSNSMAHAAAVSVAEKPGLAYNPLFLYGGVGLGKTHLMHAIGNEMQRLNPEAKILYVSCETFTNELISAIRDKVNNGTEKFRQKYREIDLLLIDDIQFISDKTGTQEEFFFTFNDLWQRGKQIVITSDRHPSNIQNLTDRLKSRLGGGLPIDIGYPNIETRVAILQAKAENQGIKIDYDVLQYIAETVKSNIREMEGALTTVIAYSKLAAQPNDVITLELALTALKDKIGTAKPEINIDYIQSVVGNYYGFTSEDLCSKKKTKDLALARQIAMYLSRKLLDETYIDIGKKFGGKDHSTVMHAVNLVENKMDESSELKVQISDIEKIVTGK